MGKATIMVVEFRSGYIGLTTDTKAQVLRREGTANVKDVRRATKQEIEWVRAMGGRVPQV